MNRTWLEWMFLFLGNRGAKKNKTRNAPFLSAASCIDDYFPQPIFPLSHLNSTKEQQKV